MSELSAQPQPRCDVVGLGCCCWDLVGIVDEYPLLDQKRPLRELRQQGGGLVATATVAVARLGGQACFIGRVGDDDWGVKTSEAFVAENVSIEGLQMMAGHTSQFAFCIAHTPTGQRSIFYKYGSWPLLEPADLNQELVRSGKVLLVDFHHPRAAIQAAKWAREAGIPSVLDIERAGVETRDLLAAIDYPVVPEHFALEYGGGGTLEVAARRFLDFGPRAFVVTQGASGCTAFVEGEIIFQPAFRIDPVVDTTGAGDVFHGAFAYGLALGYDLRRNLRFASAAAALKCRQLGGRAGIPSMDEVTEFLAANE